MDIPFYQGQAQFLDQQLSMGNFFVDLAGNTVMDLNAASAGHPLGY